MISCCLIMGKCGEEVLLPTSWVYINKCSLRLTIGLDILIQNIFYETCFFDHFLSYSIQRNLIQFMKAI